MRNDHLFDHPTGTWAAIGAVLGVIVVMAASLIAIVLWGSGPELLAVGAMAAVFGGVGMGAMLGATLAQFHEPAPALVRVTGSSQPDRRML